MNIEVDIYFKNLDKWKAELSELRTLLLDCGLTEELKWKSPCYTFKGKNICVIGPFKAHCVLSFFKGYLLKDTENILVKPGENTQSARIIKFTDSTTIIKLAELLKTYIFEAIEIENSNEKHLKQSDSKSLNAKQVYPDELKQILNENEQLTTAFEALTPGRKRAYIMYFSAAKQSKTKKARIEKYIPRILSGKGINDCVCGLSKRMPNCDGSHKFIN